MYNLIYWHQARVLHRRVGAVPYRWKTEIYSERFNFYAPPTFLRPPRIILVHHLITLAPIATCVGRPDFLPLKIARLKISRFQREIGMTESSLPEIVQTMVEVPRACNPCFCECNIEHAEAMHLVVHRNGENAIFGTQPEVPRACVLVGHGKPFCVWVFPEDRIVNTLFVGHRDKGEIAYGEIFWKIVSMIGWYTLMISSGNQRYVDVLTVKAIGRTFKSHLPVPTDVCQIHYTQWKQKCESHTLAFRRHQRPRQSTNGKRMEYMYIHSGPHRGSRGTWL